MKTKIEIENLKCQGCANTIKQALTKMNGVNNVKVIFNPESVDVDFDANIVTLDKIVLTLSKLGYPQKGNNSLMKNMKSYVSCAIGRIKKGDKL